MSEFTPLVIKTRGLNGPFTVFSHEGFELHPDHTSDHGRQEFQTDYDMVLAFAQGLMDNLHEGDAELRLEFDYTRGHPASDYRVKHFRSASFRVKDEEIYGPTNLLAYCRDNATHGHGSFTATICVDQNAYLFDITNRNLKAVYQEAREKRRE